MKVRILFVFVVFTRWSWTHSITKSMSGVIADDTTFFYKTFPVSPLRMAIIEVDVRDFTGSSRLKGHYPMVGIYTTQDHINFKKQCTDRVYGQLGNEYLHPGITTDTDESRLLICKNGLPNMLHCTGNITVQDFIPRKFSFSFGFRCDNVDASDSLKGLFYNMSIYGTNKTECFELPPNNTCYRYLQHGVLHNLMGIEYQEDLGKINRFTYLDLLRYMPHCYQHLHEFLCYVVVPKCDPELKQVIPPCKEMCQDANDACNNLERLNCDYLPSLGGEISCFYEPVFCTAPPTVKNARVKTNSTEYLNHFLYDRAKYSCNKGYKIIGNNSISCTYSGRWSTPPHCSLKSTNASKSSNLSQEIMKSKSSNLHLNPIPVVLPILLTLLSLLVLIFAVRYKVKLKRKRKLDNTLTAEKQIEFAVLSSDTVLPLKRKRIFDAFVLYHFDTDDRFIIDYLQPELEGNRNLKLCIHSRDFTPGRDIKDNIEEAIEGSNSAIIVMSQGFVDSMWCKEEFTHCYIENMKDPAFNLFVIMMQPADTLVNISPYMKTFFANKTYLERDDPELFTKLAAHMEDDRDSEKEDADNDPWEYRQ